MKNNKLLSLQDLKNQTDSKKVILYGAGVVGKALAMYLLSNKEIADNVYCFAVTEKGNNPDIILGIPVCTINDISLDKNTIVIISVLEKQQKEIEEKLREKDFQAYLKISNVVYAELRKNNPSFELDIEQNATAISRRTQRIEAALNRIERCIQAGTRYYEEALEPREYRDGLRQWYKEKTKMELDLDNPITFNEKIQWMKLYGISPLMTKLADKYKVRQWVSEKIGEKYLVPLIGVWDRFDDIDFSEMPDKFVLKCNHGSNWNMIVRNKSEMNLKESKRLFDRWMSANFAFKEGFEMQYRDIVPKIIAEEYMENEQKDLYDYKFWCFNGKVEFIMFLSDRQNALKMDNYDTEWNLLPFVYDYPNSGKKIKKPVCLEQMIKLAENLSDGFTFVRVDFYLLNDGQIKFGEMTFTPDSGICRWNREDINIRLGTLMKLQSN